jgi:hypothetical protein
MDGEFLGARTITVEQKNLGKFSTSSLSATFLAYVKFGEECSNAFFVIGQVFWRGRHVGRKSDG